MGKYIVKRLVATVITLLLLSALLFGLTHLSGNPARTILGVKATEEQVQKYNEDHGLDDPVPVQYFRWLGGIFQGDFGTSLYRNSAVSDLIGSHFWPTMELAFWSFLISIIIAIPVGVFSAKHKGKIQDTCASFFSLIGLSIPPFLFALLLMMIFCVGLRILPTNGWKELSRYSFGDHIQALILPAASLGIAQAAIITRTVRSTVIETLAMDFVKAAKAKGVKAKAVLYKHALGNAWIPIITILGQSLGNLIGGAVIIETIFNIPGLGQLVMDSISDRDYSVIQGVTLVLAAIYVFINLAVDIIYGLVDPRIRVAGGSK